MNKQSLEQAWDQFRQKYGVYLRLLEAFPEDRYYTHPVPGMRTAAELVVHISGSVVRDIARGVAKGSITADESADAKVAADLGGKAALIAFARRCFEEATTAVDTIGDSQLSAMVSTPWNMTFPGWVGFAIMTDEFLHHRGQLYTYARLCGVEPPFIWGFQDNAPDYRPLQSREAAPAGV
jgi:uncharacterized damage-inducible protein DinB